MYGILFGWTVPNLDPWQPCYAAVDSISEARRLVFWFSFCFFYDCFFPVVFRLQGLVFVSVVPESFFS